MPRAQHLARASAVQHQQPCTSTHTTATQCAPMPQPPARSGTRSPSGTRPPARTHPPLQHVCGDGGIVHISRHARPRQPRQWVREGPPRGVDIQLRQQLAQPLPGHAHRPPGLPQHCEARVAPRQQQVAARQRHQLRWGADGRQGGRNSGDIKKPACGTACLPAAAACCNGM